MLEIKITAPEISEAINNLARAIGLAVTNPVGMTIGVVPTNTTCATVEEPEVHTFPVVTAEAPIAPIAPVATTPAVTAEVPTAPVVPTAVPQYTLDMLANAGATLVNAGKMNEVTALLAKYGVEAITSLDPSMYGTIAMELRNLGAQI